LTALSAALSVIFFIAGCKAKVPAIESVFTDDFERAEPGPLWLDTGGGYTIRGGNLNARKAYNHPLWLQRRLPANVKIEFDALSKSPSGDIKIELFGDGSTFDPDKGAYVASGYVLIFGGWNNSLSALCRQNEHNEGVKAQRRAPPVEVGRTYHMTITRRHGQIDWMIDGEPFLSWNDPEPLRGSGHEFFAFSNWEADVYFDNLKIVSLQ